MSDIAKWIYRVTGRGDTIHCSRCNTRILYGIKPNFCANCGVRFTVWDDSEVKEWRERESGCAR